MKIKIWGPRGSIPSPLKSEEIEDKICQAIYGMPSIDTTDREAIRNYVSKLPLLLRGTAGGNTSCVEIKIDDQETLIIDAGSGLRELGLDLMEGPWGQGQGIIHLLFSHAHWDHIQGFPFFRPAFVPGNQIFIYSIHNLQTVLKKQQLAPNFPISLAHMQATMKFILLQVGQPFSIGKLNINTIENVHPGKAYSYRFEDKHSVFVYANDAEYKHLNDASVQPHIDFFRNADALIFDAQYTLREAWDKVDWGHSSALIGVDLARAAGVKKLILFHHDPTYSDTQLQEIQARAIVYQDQDTTLPTCDVIIGYEGLTIDLTPPNTIELQLMLDNKAAILTPISIFDERGVNQLSQQLANLSKQNTPSNSIIDLSQVETLTTASLKSLVALRKTDEGASKIVLAGPSENALRVIQLSNYQDFFAIYPSVDAALAALQARETLNLPGQVIKNQYQIQNKIGEGQQDIVLKAIDLQTNQTVALKILAPSYSQKAINRFMYQNRRLVGLEHKNIVKVFALDQEGSHTFVVEEYITEQTLFDLLKNINAPLPAEQALDIVMGLINGLEHAHSHGIIHGDLKPQAILLTQQGIKIKNFGLGRLEEGRNLLEAPILRLTAAYLAPEQILGQAIDTRTDLYAMGVILYQLFSGQLPFEGTDNDIMQAHLHQVPRAPRELNPNISLSLEHLTLKLLAKTPHDRYASTDQAYRVSSGLIINGRKTTYQSETLIGRQKQLQALQSCWADASAGRGQLAFISGEAGIGKTTLAQQVAMQSQSPVLLIGQCQELKGTPPYQPFIEVLQTYFATVPPEFFDEEARQLVENFAHLVPEIRQALPKLSEPSPLEPQQEHIRLMSNLAQFIKRATAERPWLLILDNLHWADQNSLELLHYLSHQLPTMALLIIGTYRDTNLERGHPLLKTLRDLSSHPTYRHIPLNRLNQTAVGQILANIWQHPVPADLLKKIYEHTNGNPFYVEEVAKGLLDDGLITLTGEKTNFPQVDEINLPQTIHEAVWQRIGHLSSGTQTLLHQAAILGQTFKFDELQEMSNLPEWEVLEHLGLAMERQLVQEAPGETNLRFSYAEIQYVLYNDLGPLRRRMLHRQAGEALERLAMPNPERIAGTLTHHFSEAGEFDKALVYSIQAARQAEATYANEAALQWYKRTLEMLEQLNPKEATQFQPLRLSVHKYLGKVLTLMGHYDDALAHYTLAQEFVNIEPAPTDHTHQLADLYCQTAEVYEKRSDYNRTFELLTQALNHLEDDTSSYETARIYLIGARAFDHQGQLKKAMDWCHKSLAIASQIKTRKGQQLMARIYTRLSAISLGRGYFDLAVGFCHDSVQIYQQINDIAGQIASYNKLGTAHFYLGDWEQAGQAYTHSLMIAQEIGDIGGQGRANNNLANIHLNRGEMNQALSLLKQSQAIWQQIGMIKNEAKTLNRLAQAHICQKNWEQVWAYLNRSQDIFTEIDSSDYLPELERIWGEYYLKTNKLEKALNHTQRSIELAARQHNPLENGRAHLLLGQIHIAQNKLKSAEETLHQSLQTFRTLHSKYEIAKTRLSLANLAIETNAANMAQAYLTQAINTFKKIGAQIDLTTAQAVQDKLKNKG